MQGRVVKGDLIQHGVVFRTGKGIIFGAADHPRQASQHENHMSPAWPARPGHRRLPRWEPSCLHASWLLMMVAAPPGASTSFHFCFPRTPPVPEHVHSLSPLLKSPLEPLHRFRRQLPLVGRYPVLGFVVIVGEFVHHISSLNPSRLRCMALFSHASQTGSQKQKLSSPTILEVRQLVRTNLLVIPESA